MKATTAPCLRHLVARSSSSALWFSLLAAALFSFSACGEKPSFHDKQSEDPNGTKPSLDQVRGGEADDYPSRRPGEDSTDGDHEGTEGPGGATDSVDEGAAGTGGPDGNGTPGGDGDGTNPDGTPGPGGQTGGTPGGTPNNPPRTLTRVMQFPSHVLADANATATLDSPYLTQSLALRRQFADKSRQVTQAMRPQATDSFSQGSEGSPFTETFNQVADRPLDILVVVDNSGSMKEEQANLAAKLQPLLSYVGDADWQIGVVTTDPNDNCLRRLIKKGDRDAAQLFAAAVSPGTNGSSNERGLLQSVRSLAGTCLNAPWIRTTSTVAVLIVSDEDNCSDGSECPGKDYAQASYLTNFLGTIRETGKNARVYGIIWHPSQNQDACPTALNQGKIYAEAIAKTSGTWGSICDADYTATLSAMSKNIAAVLNARFTLRYAPEAGSVQVFYDGIAVTNGITVAGRVVELTPPPPEGTKVTVAYRYGSQPRLTRFPLRYTPYAGLVAVTVNGAAVPPTAYTVDTTGPALVFAVPPPDLAAISVNYVRDVPLTTDFALADEIVSDSLNVTVDGMPAVPGRDYTLRATTGLVTFAVAPQPGSVLLFSYRALGAAVLRYPFTLTSGKPVDLIGYDAQTRAPVRLAYAADVLEVHPDDFRDGRVVTLQVDNVARQKFAVALPHAPVLSTVVAKGGRTTCTGAGKITLQDTTVAVDGCGFADDVQTVQVSYRYVVSTNAEFVFAAPSLPGPLDFQQWTVWVNDIVRTDYVREGNRFRFAVALPVGATVKIQLLQEDK